MSNDPRHRLGRAGEEAAAAHLERLGYEIVARNPRTRFGELDLVALDGDTLVFCEVKTRRASPHGCPWDALGNGKRDRVRRLAAAWLSDTAERPRPEELRFDAIAVTVDARGRLARLEHLEGAF